MDPRIWHKVAAISGSFLNCSSFYVFYYYFFFEMYALNSFAPFYSTLEDIVVFVLFMIYDFCKINCYQFSCFNFRKFIGIAALGLGTYGAHAFKPKNPSYKEVSFNICISLFRLFWINENKKYKETEVMFSINWL